MKKKLLKALDKELFFGLKPLELLIGVILIVYAYIVAIYITSR